MSSDNMTLAEMRTYILHNMRSHWQRGPSDYAGYERDRDARAAVKRARTWAALADAAGDAYDQTGSLYECAVNRCTRENL